VETPSNYPDIEAAILAVERSLCALKQRYNQVQQDQRRQTELKNRVEEILPEFRRNRTQQMREELKQLEAELETIELNLESHLFTWSSLKEPFWQAVRFGGAGVVLGWLLNTMAG
jgi:chromosome segregation ATPase